MYSLFLKTFCCFIFLFCSTALFAQKYFFVEAFANPILVPIGMIGVEEWGLGYYEFNYQQKTKGEYGIHLGRKLKNQLEWGLGCSYKKVNMDFDYTILNPLSETEIVANEMRFLNRHFFGIRGFIGYQYKKFKIRTIIEANDPYRVELSEIKESTWLTLYIDPETQNITYLSILEDLTPPSGPYEYVIPEINISYGIKNFWIQAGFKYKWKANRFYSYKLAIRGETTSLGEDTQILNDIRIYNKFAFGYFGLLYHFKL